MICCFCAAHLDTREEAVDAGWWPSFYVGEVEYEGPVCPHCVGRHLAAGADGELGLRPGEPLPPLAIPLNPHPNLRV